MNLRKVDGLKNAMSHLIDLGNLTLHGLTRERSVTPAEFASPNGSAPAAFTGFAIREIERPINERFETIVQRYPHHIAVQSAEQNLTYAALNRAANTLAHAMVAELGEGHEPVALLFDHTAALIVALMAVLKAGKAYLVLDPTHPTDRLATRLGELQIRLLVTSAVYAAVAAQIVPASSGLLNLDTLAVTDETAQNLGIFPPADQAAGLFSTSGSTGAPKTVARKHHTLLHRVWLETTEEQFSANDRFALLYTCSYAASANHLFCALLNGAQLCLYDIRAQGTAGLAAWLQQNRITCMQIAAPLFRQFLNTLQSTDVFTTMRQVIPSSQQIYKSDVTRFWAHFPATCKLISRFSASETAIVCRMVITPETEISGHVVPVGYPVPGKEVLILDEAGNPLGPDQVGEIAVRSRYLAGGYWGKAALTKEKFITHGSDDDQALYRMGDWGRMRPDGCLEFLGRKDEMVKIRGYRVELGEVEAALYTLPMVKAAAVVAHKRAKPGEPAGDPAIIAYLVPRTQPSPMTHALRTALAATLPDYMLPVQFIMLQQLPMTPNGKIDRKALPPLSDDAQQERPLLDIPYAPPRTPLEETLVNIWQEVLGVEPVGIDDHFLDLGSNSLCVMQVHARLFSQLQSELPAHLIFACTTVAEMALLITQQQAAQADQAELAQLLAMLEAAPHEETPIIG